MVARNFQLEQMEHEGGEEKVRGASNEASLGAYSILTLHASLRIRRFVLRRIPPLPPLLPLLLLPPLHVPLLQ